LGATESKGKVVRLGVRREYLLFFPTVVRALYREPEWNRNG